jgi:homoserine dehydrogenase
MRAIKIGLFGYGCVGQGLYQTINNSKNFEGEIVKICVKDRNKKRSLPTNLFTFNKEEILEDPSIDVIVELIDNAEAALEIVTTALNNGKSVVTANKKMVAENLEYLIDLQQKTGKAILYEGAVCGSIPIIRTLEEYFGHEPINQIKGIFNGSTNYILTKIFQEKMDYEQALEQAKEKGFAESDPTLDVKGFDPKYKLSILLTHAFGINVSPDKITNLGIDHLQSSDLEFAHKHGYSIKLIAQAIRKNDEVFACVLPQFIKSDHNLRNVNNEFNAVTLNGEFCDDQLFIGKGAGSLPTGAAVLSDISALSYDYKYEYKKHYNQGKVHFNNDNEVTVYASFQKPEDIDLNEFEQVSDKYFCFDRSYVIGKIKLSKLLRSKWVYNSKISVIQFDQSDEFSNELDLKTLETEILELRKGQKLREKISV